MSEPYLGEIRLVPYTFAPQGWAFCSGQTLSIAQNDALFNLIGTTYGGDGVNTFLLPNLQSRIPVHQGSSFVLGQLAGAETVTLTTNQLPVHNHTATCNSGAGQTVQSPVGAVWVNYSDNQYTDQPTPALMNAGAISNTGGNQPHDNLMPYMTINFIIALQGIYPTQN